MDEVILQLENLTIGYNKPLLSSINTNLLRGDFNLLLGANGVGKSTLIKTILQQIKTLSGQIKIKNKNLQEYNHTDISKLISIVTTNNNFDANLTVSDVLNLGRIPYLNFFAKMKEEDILLVNKYAHLLNLEALKQKYFNQLSDGQKQKVLIARALIQDTPIIILDEPTAHLDVRNRMLIFKLLRSIAINENKAIVCATHEIDLALKQATKVWIIDKHNNFIEDRAEKFNTEIIYCNLF